MSDHERDRNAKTRIPLQEGNVASCEEQILAGCKFYNRTSQDWLLPGAQQPNTAPRDMEEVSIRNILQRIVHTRHFVCGEGRRLVNHDSARPFGVMLLVLSQHA